MCVPGRNMVRGLVEHIREFHNAILGLEDMFVTERAVSFDHTCIAVSHWPHNRCFIVQHLMTLYYLSRDCALPRLTIFSDCRVFTFSVRAQYTDALLLQILHPDNHIQRSRNFVVVYFTKFSFCGCFK
jgi:hypothetical protein